MKPEANLMDKIIALCKRRGFVYPGSEIYGGLANSWDYGPLGVELKNNIKQLWWKRFVHERSDMVGLDAALIMNPKVWEASGHIGNFSDPLVECKKCHARFRADESGISNFEFLISKDESGKEIKKLKCPNCKGTEFSEPRQFNLMLKTFLGPAEEKANEVYFRPETAQAMFVNFKNVMDSSRVRIPFGIAQIGKAFRNEITPGNFIFRTREFEQMEIEYFIAPPKAGAQTNADGTQTNAEGKAWEEYFEYWRNEMLNWIYSLGISKDHVHELEVPKDELAHYSKRTIDFEYDFPFGRKELYGLAYRTDFDLKNHEKNSGQKLQYRDPETNEEYTPHVIEPTFGVDRTLLAVLTDSYTEDGERVYLKLKPQLAPYKAAVFPLLANKPALVEKAREIYKLLTLNSQLGPIAWDERGNVGKRYYAQDEIGTPYCVTVDFDTLGPSAAEAMEGKEIDVDKKDTVTIRDRDTAKQERIKISELKDWLKTRLSQ